MNFHIDFILKHIESKIEIREHVPPPPLKKGGNASCVAHSAILALLWNRVNTYTSHTHYTIQIPQKTLQSRLSSI